MTEPTDPSAKKSPTETLAELVAKRKAAAGGAGSHGQQGRKATERAAAAHANSKWKPAPRKG